MIIKTNKFKSFFDQQPGTSGLRRKTKHFMQEHYLESFVQATLNAIKEQAEGKIEEAPLIIGGDGRFFNKEAIQKIMRVALANGYKHLCIAKGGILSTPAASVEIRKRKASGGFILSASHNPAGLNEDFGIKYNCENGGPAQEKLTNRIFEISKALTEYKITEIPEINIDSIGALILASGAKIEIFDGVKNYADLMQNLFDFGKIRTLFENGFKMRFDAMYAVTGPYAKVIFEDLLGAPLGSVEHFIPREDFGGEHPDPNQVHAKHLIDFMYSAKAADFAAASDGDGDRNLIVGKKCFVSPGDSLAIIASEAKKCIPAFKGGLKGVARSMPTSQALDLVAKKLNIESFETPTGWKYFVNLMDTGKCSICGEESFGTGGDHIREKDGIWAVLCWLSILAHYEKKSVQDIVTDFWKEFGRNYYQRHDYEGLDAEIASNFCDNLRGKLEEFIGQEIGKYKIRYADDFNYTDAVDNSVTSKQGIRIFLCNAGKEEVGRVVFRLSGTGSSGALLRVYYELFEREKINLTSDEALKDIIVSAQKFLRLKEVFDKDKADVIT